MTTRSLLRPGTSVEDLYVTLRERIVSGHYAPGMRLSQQAIAAELNVSRTPVREALNRLETEGLVVSNANRGMEVAPASLDVVEEAYSIRLLVEPPTMQVVVDTATKEDLREMAEALAVMETPGIETQAYQEAHLAFHQVLLDRYPRSIANLTKGLHTKIYRHQRVYLQRPAALTDFNHVDRAFLAALRAGDSDLARQLLEFHLVDAAIGSILDIDAEHDFHDLSMTLEGLGIHVHLRSQGSGLGPAAVSWSRMGAAQMPPICTRHLKTEDFDNEECA